MTIRRKTTKSATTNTPKPRPPRRKVGSSESSVARARRAEEVLSRLRGLYAEAECALTHASPLQLLIATILSAQCTDDRVNKVTPALFKRFPTAKAFAAADQAEVEGLIQSTGFFRNKAKNIIGAGRVICEKFGGQVPDTMEALLELPGVARKTANVVLGTGFGKNEGFVVDTHIGRLAERLGLTWRSKDSKDAVKIERDLMEIVPQADWTYLGHALIWHGRKVCSARKPNCTGCVLRDICPSASLLGEDGPNAETRKEDDAKRSIRKVQRKSVR